MKSFVLFQMDKEDGQSLKIHTVIMARNMKQAAKILHGELAKDATEQRGKITFPLVRFSFPEHELIGDTEIEFREYQLGHVKLLNFTDAPLVCELVEVPIIA